MDFPALGAAYMYLTPTYFRDFHELKINREIKISRKNPCEI